MIYANFNKKLKIYKIFVFFVLFAIIAKLCYIQIVSYNKINNLANESWERSFPLEANRGIIYDSNLNELASNIASMSLYVIPSQIDDKQTVAKKISEILNVNQIDLYNKINKKESIIKVFPEGKHLSEDKAKKIMDLNIDGVYLVYDNKRYYPYNTMLAHTIGFTGIDNQGLTGLENKYDELLIGSKGSLNYKLDAKGHLLN